MKRLKLSAMARCVIGALFLTSMLSACETMNGLLATDKVDYKGAATAPSLDVPPDLTSTKPNPAFVVPPVEAVPGAALARQPTAAGNKTIGIPTASDPLGMHVERDGQTHILVIDGRTPEQLWPQLKEFWEENGFILQVDQPNAGVLETDWAENRAKIPSDWFRSTFGKLVDKLYSSGTKDKFRMLVERSGNGGTDITITQRGMEEMLIGRYGETSRWVDRPREPALEAALLDKLMQKFGLTAAQAQQLNAAAEPAVPRASVVLSQGDAPTIRMAETPQQAWPRVGLALDRSHFVVDRLDQDHGIYYVHYVDPELEVSKEGFLGRLFTSSKQPAPHQYRVSVQPGTQAGTEVSVVEANGQRDASVEARRILAALQAQLN